MVVLAVTATTAGCSSCRRERQLEVPETVYREAVSAFYTGLAALQTSQEPLARQKFDRVTALVPEEPAAWANLGLLLLRQQDLDASAERLAKAAALASDSGDIASLQGLVESRRGNPPEAIRHWKRALSLDAGNVRAAYALGLEIARQGGEAAESEAQQVFAGIVQRTGNLAARLELARLAAKRGDSPALHAAIEPLAAASKSWPPEAQSQLATLQAAASGDARTATTRVMFLKNVLQRVPEFRLAYGAVTTPLEALGEPIVRLLALKNPDPQPAPPDEAMTFAVKTGSEASSWAGAFPARGDGAPVVASAGPAGLALDGTTLGVAGLAGMEADPASPRLDAVLAIDANYDFLTDIVWAGARGVRLLQQAEDGTFSDVTPAMGLPPELGSAPAFGAWAADTDLDGDLDVVLATAAGPPAILRNNNDGTFAALRPFDGVPSLRGFAWGDLDGDGVPDAALLDAAGTVHVFVNERGFGFDRRTLPLPAGSVTAVGLADASGAAAFDLVWLDRSGAVSRLALGPEGPDVRRLATVKDAPKALAPGAARVVVADLDNNGAADLVVSGPQDARVLLRAGADEYRPLAQRVSMAVTSAADLDGDGRLELVGVAAGRAARAESTGRTQYHWQAFRPRAASTLGDQRINSFGIGGEVEVRSGLHAQKQAIASPLVHFGLGNATRADVVRIAWPNGMLQSEFDRPADAVVAASQRLKGSCPWLFAWNGREMAFATDLIWRSPLGLRINAQSTADVLMTEDRVRLTGGQLVPRDGSYDLRVTAELWETHFFDLVSLVAIDRPAGVEVFVDERFAVPPPGLDPVATDPLQAFAAARDDQGRDVSGVVQARDDRHLDFAGRGAYQGITRDHFVELDLPDDAPRRGPLWLVAQGWVHPTDSSVNVAISQGRHAAPRGLALHVADASGRFREVRRNVGFPAGKDKTVLLDLAGVFPPSGPRRLRLATNLEIFWDRLSWAVGRPDVALRSRAVPLSHADLRYRGFSETFRATPTAPERPRYVVEGTAPRWLDLEGYHTRFGDVLPLLRSVDDRYVIMNAGDELRLRFPALPPPAAGLERDFLVVSDGWVKDGDYNTTASRTVLPLPTHATERYDRRPRRLEDDPVYVRHPGDFAEYHTRYVTPAPARGALRAATDDGR
jgi:Tfp pilus assembly protein PilF